MLRGQDNIVGLEDPLASCVAPQQKAVISQHLIGGSEPCWYSLIGCRQCVWWLANGEKVKPKVTAAIPSFFFLRIKEAKLNLPIIYLHLSHELSSIRKSEQSRQDKACLLKKKYVDHLPRI